MRLGKGPATTHCYYARRTVLRVGLQAVQGACTRHAAARRTVAITLAEFDDARLLLTWQWVVGSEE